jgi:hypothetical protein
MGNEGSRLQRHIAYPRVSDGRHKRVIEAIANHPGNPDKQLWAAPFLNANNGLEQQKWGRYYVVKSEKQGDYINELHDFRGWLEGGSEAFDDIDDVLLWFHEQGLNYNLRPRDTSAVMVLAPSHHAPLLASLVRNHKALEIDWNIAAHRGLWIRNSYGPISNSLVRKFSTLVLESLSQQSIAATIVPGLEALCNYAVTFETMMMFEFSTMGEKFDLLGRQHMTSGRFLSVSVSVLMRLLELVMTSRIDTPIALRFCNGIERATWQRKEAPALISGMTGIPVDVCGLVKSYWLRPLGYDSVFPTAEYEVLVNFLLKFSRGLTNESRQEENRRRHVLFFSGLIRGGALSSEMLV